MGMSRPTARDLFGECNVGAHPIDQFVKECCANCINPECTRSLAGKAKFDKRTAGWFDRYFSGKSEMDRNDPRYPKIAGQAFMIINPGPVPIVGSSWQDPRDIARQQSAPPPLPAQTASVAAEPAPVSRPEKAAQSPAPPAPPAPPQTLGTKPVPHHLILANTPPPQGLMIPRPPAASPAPTAPVSPKDPWATPSANPKDGVPVVAPGGRIKLGGGV